MYLLRDEGVMTSGQGCFSCSEQVVTQQTNQDCEKTGDDDEIIDDVRLFLKVQNAGTNCFSM